jgi:hypothetical protein
MKTRRQAELQQRMVQEQAQLTRVEARLKQIEMENTMPDYFDKAHHAALKWIEANGYKSLGLTVKCTCTTQILYDRTIHLM